MSSHLQRRQHKATLLRRKVVFVGDPKVGKTSLIDALCVKNGSVDPDPYLCATYHPLVMDVRLDELEKWEEQKGIERNSNSSAITSETTTKRTGNVVAALTTDEESEILELAIWDTSSHEEEVHTRIFTYSHTEVFALCVAVDDPTSLDHALNKWAPEILHYAPQARFVLIGLKSELYYGQKASQDACNLWKRNQGSRIARRLEVDPAIGYMDCSAYTYDHVPDVLFAIAHVGLKAKGVNEKQRGDVSLSSGFIGTSL